MPQFELLFGPKFLDDCAIGEMAGAIRALQGAIPGPIPRPSLALVGREFLQPPPLSDRVPAERNFSADVSTEFEVEGEVTVFVVSSAMDGRGTRPGMAGSNDKGSSLSLYLALTLEPIQTEAHAIGDSI